MDEDAQMDALNQLWQNFCTTYTYEPGSTAKPFTVAAGLETGKVSTGDSFTVMDMSMWEDMIFTV